MANKKIDIQDIQKELDSIFIDYIKQSFEVRQEALQAGAEVFKTAIENATPKDTEEMAQSWKIKDKYKDRRYVGNTKVVNGGDKDNIPLSNVLEYKKDSKHYGSIRQTFENTQTQIFDTIKNKINGGK